MGWPPISTYKRLGLDRPHGGGTVRAAAGLPRASIAGTVVNESGAVGLRVPPGCDREVCPGDSQNDVIDCDAVPSSDLFEHGQTYSFRRGSTVISWSVRSGHPRRSHVARPLASSPASIMGVTRSARPGAPSDRSLS